MSLYGKVYAKFWESEDMRALSDDGRMLALYLLTCKHRTIAGCFRLPDGYASEDLQWGFERVSKGFCELSEKGFATRCDVTNWVWIRRYLEQNPLENPNQRKAAAKLVLTIPSRCTWGAEFLAWCADEMAIDLSREEFANRFERVSEQSSNQYQYQEQKQEEQKQNPPKPPAAAGGSPGRKREGVTYQQFVQACREQGERPLPADHSVFAFATDSGIPREYLELAWREFARQYRDTQKTQAGVLGWRKKFENCVRRNWFKLWWFTPEQACELTTAGQQLKREREADQKRKAEEQTTSGQEQAA
ncbi:hypothetical protein [Lysobacter antibioticus]|uniref:hypothetical protein n=1 Tax=Lysobacter antibioticus TaxID=84531 RepID=UPI0007E8DFEF|nr:hypothetical protein [Lysobacter antibioticus]